MPVTTDNTVIAVFRNSADAQAAASDLQAAGISRDNIYVDASAGGSSQSTTTGTTHQEGGITGWFKSIFGENDDPDRSQYETAVNRGSALLRVDVAEAQIDGVEEILNRHSPVDVHEEQSSARTSGATRTGANAGYSAAAAGTTQNAGATEGAIPVVREELQVGKRQVLRGGVRVYSRTVSQPVEESVRLREERVRVDRRPVDRAATEADLTAGRERVIEVQEFAEEPVVAKQARVVEEIRVGKDVSERQETIRDTVRHTEVDVQQTPQGTGSGYDDSDFRADFQRRYGQQGSATYDTYAPAYQYGYTMASDPRYSGRSFSESESELRADYGRRYPNSTWDRMKDSIQYGWDKVTGKTTATNR